MLTCDNHEAECPGRETDCCEVLRPCSEVTDHRDINGDVLVTQCDPGFGCNTDPRSNR